MVPDGKVKVHATGFSTCKSKSIRRELKTGSKKLTRMVIRQLKKLLGIFHAQDIVLFNSRWLNIEIGIAA
jgi:hypothetical protein